MDIAGARPGAATIGPVSVHYVWFVTLVPVHTRASTKGPVYPARVGKGLPSRLVVLPA